MGRYTDTDINFRGWRVHLWDTAVRSAHLPGAVPSQLLPPKFRVRGGKGGRQLPAAWNKGPAIV